MELTLVAAAGAFSGEVSVFDMPGNEELAPLGAPGDVSRLPGLVDPAPGGGLEWETGLRGGKVLRTGEVL